MSAIQPQFSYLSLSGSVCVYVCVCTCVSEQCLNSLKEGLGFHGAGVTGRCDRQVSATGPECRKLSLAYLKKAPISVNCSLQSFDYYFFNVITQSVGCLPRVHAALVYISSISRVGWHPQLLSVQQAGAA